MKPTVLLDVDGVVADFVEATLRRLEEDFSISADHNSSDWPVRSITDYKHFKFRIPGCKPPSKNQMRDVLGMVWNEPHFASTIRPYEGAVDGVKSLMEIADVYFVTSPIWTSDTWMFDRALWLRDHFGIDNSRSIFTSSKHLVRGDIFVDDKPETVFKWETHNGGFAAVWDQPYNRDAMDLTRADSWNELALMARLIASREED